MKLLKECGAIEIPRSGHTGNVRYRLPNGKLFVRSSILRGRAAINQYKTLTGLLKETA